jgi:hypothetical protein
MSDEDQRNRQPEDNLPRLSDRHPQMRPAVDRNQRERQMDGERAVKKDGSGPTAPKDEEPPSARVQRPDRNQAKSVIEKVGGEKDKNDQTGPEPNPANRVSSGARRLSLPVRSHLFSALPTGGIGHERRVSFKGNARAPSKAQNLENREHGETNSGCPKVDKTLDKDYLLLIMASTLSQPISA